MKAFREKTKLTETLLPGFPVFGVDVTGRDLAAQNSPLRNDIIVQARRLEASGLKGVELEREAVVSAVEEYMERQKRQIEQTILTSQTSAADQEANATMRAVQDVFKTAKIAPIVEALLAGDLPELPPARRPIDLDEDLSGVNP
jgi:hypothetical protein